MATTSEAGDRAPRRGLYCFGARAGATAARPLPDQPGGDEPLGEPAARGGRGAEHDADPAAQGDFVRTSRALLVNLGMLDLQRVEAARARSTWRRRLGRPWLLDPVKVERSGPRLDLARGLIAAAPALVRCNRDEAGALAGEEAARLRPEPAARPRGHGAVDVVTDGSRTARIANGSPLMDRVAPRWAARRPRSRAPSSPSSRDAYVADRRGAADGRRGRGGRGRGGARARELRAGVPGRRATRSTPPR